VKPITRIEQLLSGIELTPITRLETYIASLNGQNVITPSPATREEQILSGTELKPITRREMFMMYGMGMISDIPTPITREEWFWKNWSGGEPKEYEVYVSGILPLHLTNSVGADLVDWSITGDTAQDGEPSPENPIEVKGVGDYDASTGMYKIPAVSRGKNLANVVPFVSTWANKNSEVLNILNKLEVGTYTVSLTYQLETRYDLSDESECRFSIVGQKITQIKKSWSGKIIGDKNVITMTFNVTSKGEFTNVYFYGCGINGIGSTGSANVLDFQIELGSTATEYEPYRPSIISTQYLPTPLMANERLTPTAREVKWGVVKASDLTWAKRDDSLNYTYTTWIQNKYNPESFKCNKYNITTSVFSSMPDFTIRGTTTGGTVCIRDSRFPTLSEFVKSLNDVYIYYQRTIPTTEPVTTTPIGTLDGECWIDSYTEVKPVSMSATYKSSKPDNDMQSLMELFKEV